MYTHFGFLLSYMARFGEIVPSLAATFVDLHPQCEMQSGKYQRLLKNIPHTPTVITTRMQTSITSTINLKWHECCIILSRLYHLPPSIPLFPALPLLAVCHGWASSTGVLWQKPAQQEYFSLWCHNSCALWERCQGLFSIIRSYLTSTTLLLHSHTR